MTEPSERAFKLDGVRDTQMRALEDLLLAPAGRVVVLHRAPGSGKTGLALWFGKRHQARFPGGRAIAVGPHIDDSDAFLEELSRDSRSLLVIDEIDRAPLATFTEALARIREKRPLASIVMTSNIAVMAGDNDWHTVEMPPLGTAQIVDLLSRQSKVSPRRLERLVDLLAGNATAVEEASRRLASGMPAERIVEWFESGRLTIARDPEGRALPDGSPERARLDLAIDEIGDSLIEDLAARPEGLYELDPRKFEKLVAELYRRRGFEATLTPASGDEGVDIYVVSHNDLGRTLWVVQAKRYAAHNRIEAGVVRELYGTVMAKNASAGILVTTSFFQPGATKLERQLEYRITLRDYLGLQEMLRQPRLQGSNAR